MSQRTKRRKAKRRAEKAASTAAEDAKAKEPGYKLVLDTGQTFYPDRDELTGAMHISDCVSLDVVPDGGDLVMTETPVLNMPEGEFDKRVGASVQRYGRALGAFTHKQDGVDLAILQAGLLNAYLKMGMLTQEDWTGMAVNNAFKGPNPGIVQNDLFGRMQRFGRRHPELCEDREDPIDYGSLRAWFDGRTRMPGKIELLEVVHVLAKKAGSEPTLERHYQGFLKGEEGNDIPALHEHLRTIRRLYKYLTRTRLVKLARLARQHGVSIDEIQQSWRRDGDGQAQPAPKAAKKLPPDVATVEKQVRKQLDTYPELQYVMDHMADNFEQIVAPARVRSCVQMKTREAWEQKRAQYEARDHRVKLAARTKSPTVRRVVKYSNSDLVRGVHLCSAALDEIILAYMSHRAEQRGEQFPAWQEAQALQTLLEMHFGVQNPHHRFMKQIYKAKIPETDTDAYRRQADQRALMMARDSFFTLFQAMFRPGEFTEDHALQFEQEMMKKVQVEMATRGAAQGRTVALYPYMEHALGHVKMLAKAITSGTIDQTLTSMDCYNLPDEFKFPRGTVANLVDVSVRLTRKLPEEYWLYHIFNTVMSSFDDPELRAAVEQTEYKNVTKHTLRGDLGKVRKYLHANGYLVDQHETWRLFSAHLFLMQDIMAGRIRDLTKKSNVSAALRKQLMDPDEMWRVGKELLEGRTTNLPDDPFESATYLYGFSKTCASRPDGWFLTMGNRGLVQAYKGHLAERGRHSLSKPDVTKVLKGLGVDDTGLLLHKNNYA